jgi:hypothetical protein
MLRSLGMTERQLSQTVMDHRVGLPETDVALLDFGLKLSQQPTGVGWEDIEALRQQGFTDEHILELVLVTALAEFLCPLSVGLGVAPDFKPRKVISTRTTTPRRATLVSTNRPGTHAHWGRYSRTPAVCTTASCTPTTERNLRRTPRRRTGVGRGYASGCLLSIWPSVRFAIGERCGSLPR